MKRIIILSLFSLIVFLGSCDLDPVPTSAATVDNFFNDDDEISSVARIDQLEEETEGEEGETAENKSEDSGTGVADEDTGETKE